MAKTNEIGAGNVPHLSNFYNTMTAACAIDNITPQTTPIKAQIKSCFSFPCPLFESITHFKSIIRKLKIAQHGNGNIIRKNTTNSAAVSMFTKPSIPVHSIPLFVLALIMPNKLSQKLRSFDKILIAIMVCLLFTPINS